MCVTVLIEASDGQVVKVFDETVKNGSEFGLTVQILGAALNLERRIKDFIEGKAEGEGETV